MFIKIVRFNINDLDMVTVLFNRIMGMYKRLFVKPYSISENKFPDRICKCVNSIAENFRTIFDDDLSCFFLFSVQRTLFIFKSL